MSEASAAAEVSSAAFVSSAAAAVVVSGAGAAVVVSGVFNPQPAREPATIAAHNTVLKNLFFMSQFLLLTLFLYFSVFLNVFFTLSSL